MLVLIEVINQLVTSLITALSWVWWIVIPLILFLILRSLWLTYVRTLTIKKIEWVTLEIKIPNEILKTPKAIEQVFSSFYSTYSFGIKFLDKWWDGKIDGRGSFEMVGINGGMYFFVHIPTGARNLIETSFYSQFPDAEITEVDDYMELLPQVMPNKTYDMWGAEFDLVRDNPYPIKTYFQFEEDIDERRIDPVAAVAEVMSNLKEGEYILIQYVISPTGKPTGKDLEKEAKEIIEGLASGKKPTKKKGPVGQFIDGIGEFVMNLARAPVVYPTWGEGGKEEKAEKNFINMTKGMGKVIEAIENKVSKQNFEASVRFVYIDRRDSFSPLNVAAVMGFFSQYNTMNTNSFKPKPAGYGKIWGRLSSRWKKFKVDTAKRDLYNRYRSRNLGKSNRVKEEKLPIFSTEELATLYHFPITGVTAPSLRRLPSKKGEPPARLPIK